MPGAQHFTPSAPRSGWTPAAIVLLAVVVAGGAFWVARGISAGRSGTPRAVTPRGDLGADENTRIAIFEHSAPSVVGVTTRRQLARRGIAIRGAEVPEGSGTGFIWDEFGHVVTNFHVTGNGTDATRRYSVLLQGENEPIEARWVGGAENYDLAILRIEATGLNPLVLGSSSDLRVGQSVLAIGNPFGLQHTMSAGIISALHRMIEAGRDAQTGAKRYIEDVLQTDAAINPGNSGGPLLDSAGRLIGVNTAIYSEVGQSAGIGFAIPVDTVNWVVPELIRHGRVIRPTLGILFLPDIASFADGVQIQSVVENGPAAKAGLRGAIIENGLIIRREGDVIVRIGSRTIHRPTDVIAALEPYTEGTEVEVEYLREGERKTTRVRLAGPSGS